MKVAVGSSRWCGWGDKGGYDCGFALEDVRMFRDALSWLEDQAGQQYGNVADRGRLVGVEIDVW